MKSLRWGILAAVVVGGPAVAADMAVKAPPPPVAPIPYVSWTGCYIGGQAGGAFTNMRERFDDGRIRGEDFNFDNGSWIAGGHVGCQYQFSSYWLLGVEGTWSALDFDRMDHSAFTPFDERRFRADQVATAVGKIGWTWDRVLVYGVGGWAGTRLRFRAFEPAFNAVMDDSVFRSGVTAGIGVDFMPWRSVVLGIRGDWYNFSFDRTFVDSTGVVNTLNNSRADFFSVTGRISYLFNWGGPPPPVVSARY
jgi:outer membrane immunogenic protein